MILSLQQGLAQLRRFEMRQDAGRRRLVRQVNRDASYASRGMTRRAIVLLQQ